MARLLDCFSGLIGFGLATDAAIAGGRPDADGQAVQQRARELLGQARASALALGKPAEQVEAAHFAMVAWIDEVLARHPDSAFETSRPMQLEFFNSKNARSEFFHHLSALQPQDEEVREVYWEAMALGFRGQYYFEEGDAGELGKLKDLHAQQLALPPLSLADLPQEHITPQPYGTRDPSGPRNPQATQRAGLRLIAALALLIPLGYLLWFQAGGAHEAAPTLAQRLEQQVAGYTCADLTAGVAPDGSARISGFVPDAEAMQRVRDEVRALPGLESASFDLRLRPWPLCEVVALLKPYQARNHDKSTGLAINTPTAPMGRLREGDRVLIEVTNSDHDGFLWVDYYTADGGVMHLNAGPAQPKLRPGEIVVLGKDTPSSWLTAPPFGTVLVTVLFSPTPFAGAGERPPFELASTYLQRLRTLLADPAFGAQVLADLSFLETEGR